MTALARLAARPARLEHVSRSDSRARARARAMLPWQGMIQGYVHDDFRPVADQLAKQLRAAGSGGAAVCVYHRGLRVVDCWAGTRNDRGDAWEANTMALSFSTTKGVMATLVHALVDRGLLDYDD